MHVYKLVTGTIEENTYFIVQDSGETLVVDPGNDGQKIVTFIKENNLKPIAIVLTHAHYDHIGAVDCVRDAFAIPVYVHIMEKDFLVDPQLNLSSRHTDQVVARPAEFTWEKMGQTTIGNFSFRIEHIPGHSPGSTVYIFEQDSFAIVGDTLFKGGCGRTDLPTSSSHAELMEGIRAHLMTLPEETHIFSGHGGATTVGQERRTNPYLNGVTR